MWFKSFTLYSVSENFASAKLLIKKSCIRQSHWLCFVNIHLHTKNYQNIPSGLKVVFYIQFLKILPQRGYLYRNLALDYLINHALSISICMRNIIKIFLAVQKLYASNQFVNTFLGEAIYIKNLALNNIFD